ncbi:MAG: glycosyltransferase family 4 protein [Lachnospiraceae bacterium]|nr:glycosyltransferase family 4 protein [Lachnospiraceae bacterium]
MRVLMVGPAREVHGGVSAVINNYYEAGLDKKIEMEYLPSMKDGSKWCKLFVALGAYTKFVCIAWKYDIVHIHMASDSSFYRKSLFILLTKIYRKKLIVHEHGGNFREFYYESKSKLKQQFICRVLNLADKFIVLSEEWYDFFTPIVKKELLQIVNNAIVVPDITEKDYRNHNILYLGRITPEKGIRELITSFEQVRKKYPDSVLYLGGIFEEEAFSREIEGREGVRFLGWIGQEQKNKMLSECSIFALPSYFEGQPISLLEAMACGCCCIATQVGGIPQIINHNNNGILVESKKQEQLTNSLLSVIDNAEIKSRMGAEAKNTIREKYDIQLRIEQLLEIYKSI